MMRAQLKHVRTTVVSHDSYTSILLRQSQVFFKTLIKQKCPTLFDNSVVMYCIYVPLSTGLVIICQLICIFQVAHGLFEHFLFPVNDFIPECDVSKQPYKNQWSVGNGDE